MAKMKSDVLQMYYDEHGFTLRDRLVRDSPEAAARLSGPFSPIVNRIQKTRLFRSVLQKVAGFDQRRVLPGYTKEPFHKWFEKEGNNTYKNPDKTVVLFADTYLNFYEPQVGVSALQLLNSCGYEVILANVGCCQRTKISHGFLRDAKKDGARTIEGLRKYLDRGLTILVCEPSCASALNDDLPDMIEDESLADRLKEKIVMIDVFLAAEIESGNLNSVFESIAGDILIHGHCHQKALYGGAKGMKALLSKGNRAVGEIPSGCCGMAGSFGYETEHYDLSRKIGESILFPAVRSMNSGTTLVANGFSCRHQIEHFTGVRPKHWVEVIRVQSPKSIVLSPKS